MAALVRHLALAGLLVWATQAAAEEPVAAVWSKSGASALVMQGQLETCAGQAKGVNAATAMPFIPPANSVAAGAAGGAAGFLVAALISAAKTRKARLGFVAECMWRNGYVRVPLEPDEQAALAKRKSSAERTAWIQAFYLSDDFPARLSRAQRPLVPPLPAGKVEPLVWDGLRFDPARLSVADGTVAIGGTVLSGPLAHQRTARLTEAVELPVALKVRAEAGAVFHEVTVAGAAGFDETSWCGPMTIKPLLYAGRPVTGCVSEDEAGYEVRVAPRDLVGAIPARLVLLDVHSADVEFHFQPSDVDLLAPLPFTLRVKKITAKGVALEARAGAGKQSQIFWSGDLLFRPDGEAILPFWTHRLVITRSGSGVAVAFPADGDGDGWREG